MSDLREVYNTHKWMEEPERRNGLSKDYLYGVIRTLLEAIKVTVEQPTGFEVDERCSTCCGTTESFLSECVWGKCRTCNGTGTITRQLTPEEDRETLGEVLSAICSACLTTGSPCVTDYCKWWKYVSIGGHPIRRTK